MWRKWRGLLGSNGARRHPIYGWSRHARLDVCLPLLDGDLKQIDRAGLAWLETLTGLKGTHLALANAVFARSGGDRYQEQANE
jgi:hypothetical protein